ncbi:helix-turn-helix domain-containing protein [Synechococcus elongatus FACHB-1061]|uniref:helix-turn-helix domain-containing protein n=1 Tax=Synechococcus elongatus TaxID=32046 RepID=UPI0016893581|nr:helix-turn-helix domain-containing protein [Synechococcus elongatus]MBD2688734.1 helix-turn-helix domain-containing protein [Synechococcus elongatus FACHB-1061]
MTESLVYTEELYRIGAELRAAREAQGLDLAAVAAQCRVRSSYLEAIESGEVQRLPEPVFVQGFIRTYARSLGLDPDTLLADLSLADIHLAATPATAAATQRSKVAIALPSKASLGLLGLVVVIVAAIAGTGVTVWNWRQQIAFAPTATAPEPPPPPEAALSTTPLEPEPRTVASAFRGPAWAEISVDGEVVFSGMGTAGQQLSFSPKQEVTINPGRPDLIWLSRAGQAAQPLGTISQVQLYRISVQADPSSEPNPAVGDR